ncbi:MAG: response regulator transcription factor [Kofleriaceae bacterium]
MLEPRILLVDDHPVFRSGVRALLEAEGGAVIEEASSTAEAVAIAERMPFVAACVDVLIPEAGGPAVVRKLRMMQPQCAILGLSVLDEPLRAAEMLRAGAAGYALKSQSPEAMVHALATIRGGVGYLAPEISQQRVDELLTGEGDSLQRLTIRERRVFDLLVRGHSNKKVADLLTIARSTVETHRRHIMRKLEASSIVDLVHVALRHGEMGMA